MSTTNPFPDKLSIIDGLFENLVKDMSFIVIICLALIFVDSVHEKYDFYW